MCLSCGDCCLQYYNLLATFTNSLWSIDETGLKEAPMRPDRLLHDTPLTFGLYRPRPFLERPGPAWPVANTGPYEYHQQVEPGFDSKWIETVRRDRTAAKPMFEEAGLMILFRTRDLSYVKPEGVDEDHKGKGVYSTFLLREDSDSPGQTLPDDTIEVNDLLGSTELSLDSEYLIWKNIIIPLERIFRLSGMTVRQWHNKIPKYKHLQRLVKYIEGPAATAGGVGIRVGGSGFLQMRSGALIESNPTTATNVCVVCRCKAARIKTCQYLLAPPLPYSIANWTPQDIYRGCIQHRDAYILHVRTQLAHAENQVPDSQAMSALQTLYPTRGWQDLACYRQFVMAWIAYYGSGDEDLQIRKLLLGVLATYRLPQSNFFICDNYHESSSKNAALLFPKALQIVQQFSLQEQEQRSAYDTEQALTATLYPDSSLDSPLAVLAAAPF
ncbi:hypothetical protein HOY80DRAFT_1070650 [Tuber brumale]|nr:hypothetical protein HOY80DRAFT_1070650 [Tuber brumale]